MNKGTNDMHKIHYNVKNTSANTDYLTLEQDDMGIIQVSVLGLLTYMTELSISKDKDIRDFTKWFTTSDKRYHYNNKLKRYNSPQSYLAGTINNLQFGHQKDFSLTQLQTIMDIINLSVDIIDAITDDKNITLQQNKLFTKIFIQENIWSVGQAV
jgi:hypothetical protein